MKPSGSTSPDPPTPQVQVGEGSSSTFDVAVVGNKPTTVSGACRGSPTDSNSGNRYTFLLAILLLLFDINKV